MVSKGQNPGPSMPSQCSCPYNTQTPDKKGWKKLRCPWPHRHQLLEMPQSHAHLPPPGSAAAQHCPCPCFPHLQMSGVTVSPSCHQQPMTVMENRKNLDWPRVLEPAGHQEMMLDAAAMSIQRGTFVSPDKHPDGCECPGNTFIMTSHGRPRNHTFEQLISSSFFFCQTQK